MRFDPNKWYFKTYVYVIAFLCIGPLILPLALINPRYNMAKKVIITIITLIASYLLIISLSKSIESIYRYYQEVMQLLR
jgi:hypothetical protein